MKKSTWTLFSALVVVLALLAAPALSPQTVQAAGPFNVNTTADSHDLSANGVCADSSNNCSLRAAIEEANASAAPTTINLPADTYILTLGALDVAPSGGRTISIYGAGASSTVIQQNTAASRVVSIDYGMAGNTSVVISGVTISGGKNAPDGYGGAGILAGNVDAPQPDSLTLTACRVENNAITPLDVTQAGGGLRMDSGNLTVNNCVFSGNNAGTGSGGAIAYMAANAPGTVNISNSTFANNGLTNTTASGPAGGGALYINNATATIGSSTFNANLANSAGGAGAHGGAIYFNTGALTIDHTTFSGNAATGTYSRGGAIYLDNGTLSLSSSSLVGNLASSGGGGVFNHALNGATTTAINNWWGCNGGPGATGCDQAVTDNGQMTASPWIVLRHSASPNALRPGESATLTASFLQNSNSQALTTTDISVLTGRAITWSDVALGSLSNQQTFVQANGQATATFTAGTTLGMGGASVSYDNALVAAAIEVFAQADLVVSKSGPTIGVTGSSLTYTLTLSNNGPDAAPSVTLSDPLPAGLTFVSQSQTSGPAFTLSQSGNTVSNTIASLASGASATFAIVATVNASATPGAELVNTASASSPAQDPVPDNNTASASATVYVAPAIGSAASTTFTIGAAGNFSVTATGYPTPALAASGALPTGVTFTDNGDGTATLAGTPAAGTAGDYPLTLNASNATGVDASQSFVLSVGRSPATITLGTSPNPSLRGQSVTLTSTVSSSVGTPTGVVQFSMDGSVLGAPVSLNAGVASLTLSTLSGGDHSISANYNGDANFASVFTGPVTQVVIPAADIAVSVSAPSFGVVGGTLSYTITLTNHGPDAATNAMWSDTLPPYQTVVSLLQTGGPTFALANTTTSASATIASLASGATATFTLTGAIPTTTAVGTVFHNVVNAGSAVTDPVTTNNSASASSTAYTLPEITSAASTIFTVATAGTFTVTATGFPTPALAYSGALPGGVTFSDNGDGTATLAGTPAPGTVGSYPLTFTASNASGLNASQNFTLTVQAAATTVSVTSSANPSVFGQPVTFTATVTSSTGTPGAGTPTGVVQFVDSTSGAAAPLVNGVATYTTSALPGGVYAVSVTYTGDDNFLPAFAMLTPNQQVVPANTTTQLTARMGGGLYQTDVLLEATVTPVAPGAGTPFGTVTFTGDLLAPTTVALDANGHASIVVSNAARGNLGFTATYNGSVNFNGSANTQAVFAPHIVIMPLVFK